jgi:hypothetical protein
MSVLNRIRPCPCRSWRCRAIYASPLLILAAAIGVDVLIARLFGVI